MTTNDLATRLALARIATSSVIRSCDHGLKQSDIPHLQKHIAAAIEDANRLYRSQKPRIASVGHPAVLPERPSALVSSRKAGRLPPSPTGTDSSLHTAQSVDT